MNWDDKIPDLTYKTSTIVQVGDWRTNPKVYTSRQYLARCLDTAIQETEQKEIADWQKEVPNCKSARRNIYEVTADDKD